MRVSGWEQRGAALSDYDGDGRVDLAVSQNAGDTRLFRNTRGRPGLRVRLTGPGGNGPGIGSVLRLGRGGEWGPAREIHGGGGYGSQDGAVTVLALPPEGNGPLELQVRWPGGGTASHRVPAAARTVRVAAEGALEVER
jgi:hypothetical protein